MIGIGDLVRWKSGQYPKASREPFEVIAVYEDGKTVRLEGGATAPARMLEVVVSAAPALKCDMSPVDWSDDGLLQVIEAQMAEIDRLAEDKRAIQAALRHSRKDLEDAQEGEGWDRLEQATDLLGQLCIALGFDRHPLQPTGIPELDALVRYVMD